MAAYENILIGKCWRTLLYLMKVTGLFLDFVKLGFVGSGLFICQCDRLLKCVKQNMLT